MVKFAETRGMKMARHDLQSILVKHVTATEITQCPLSQTFAKAQCTCILLAKPGHTTARPPRYQMEEDTIRPAAQSGISTDHVAEDSSAGGVASPALHVDGTEVVFHDDGIREESAGVEETNASDAIASVQEPGAILRSLENLPRDTTVPTTEEALESNTGEVHSTPSSVRSSEVPTPPAKDTVSSIPPSTSVDSEGKRPQTPSRTSTTSSPNHKRSLTASKGNNVSVVLIVSALETIATSKEAKRSAPLRDSAQRALELIRSNLASDHPRDILEPLRLACETKNEKLMIASLDCISKLISYSFFAEDDIYVSNGMPSPPPSPHPTGRSSIGRASQTSIPQPSIVDLVVHTITACHTETTPETVSLQIVKALLALVLSPSVFVHHSSLLKTVRTVYNVFLLSADPVNQMVAQGGLTQMVHHVFTRCKIQDSSKTAGELAIPSYDPQAPAASSQASLTMAQPREVFNPSNGSNSSELSQGKTNKSDESSISLQQLQNSTTEDGNTPVVQSGEVIVPQMYVPVVFVDPFSSRYYPQD